jgi:glycosyltransferase involved in cell wall biosynthesis
MVDDGSNDGTAELIAELRKTRPGIHYLRRAALCSAASGSFSSWSACS